MLKIEVLRKSYLVHLKIQPNINISKIIKRLTLQLGLLVFFFNHDFIIVSMVICFSLTVASCCLFGLITWSKFIYSLFSPVRRIKLVYYRQRGGVILVAYKCRLICF